MRRFARPGRSSAWMPNHHRYRGTQRKLCQRNARPHHLFPSHLAGFSEPCVPACRCQTRLSSPCKTKPCPSTRTAILHPAALLSLSNQVLIQNVKLGPWIHVASELRHFNIARNGDQLAARARVEDRFARKGHQFVVLDILVVASGDRIIQHVRHTAIYEPRLGVGPADTA